jgi:N-methylhydantoinase A
MMRSKSKARGGSLFIGVDVGGTFTDIVVHDALRRTVVVTKTPTSIDPTTAIASWARGLRGASKRVSMVSHATTICTNALLTGSGLARTALVTNSGFRDVLEIGRQRRPEVYDLHTRRPPPLARRKDRFTVRGRIGTKGQVLEPLDTRGASQVARNIVNAGYDSVAVSFLNSHVNPSHEAEMRRLFLKEGYRGSVSLSSDIDREYREYERTSTTVVNAVLVPLMSVYIRRLASRLKRAGVNAPLYVMNSDGGMSTATYASSRPVTIIESGPAAGVLASRRIAISLSLPKVLTFDMGGTTAKAGAVIDGEPEITEEFEAAGRSHSGRSIKGSGYAVRGSFIDLAEVSAGGGTIAWVDEGGALALGPQSAGSVPGPACYGTGGKEPTVTDANVVLGRLNPRYLLGGDMPIRPGLADGALGLLASRLETSTSDVAEGVIRLANSNMSKAFSIVSIERGRDPREFTMVAFGGSGPVHCCDIAEELGVTDLVVPVHAGLFSAYGLLVADMTRTFSVPAPSNTLGLENSFRDLESSASDELKNEGIERFALSRFVEARYAGQSHELLLRYPQNGDVRAVFDQKHTQVYGYSSEDRLEIVNLRVRATVSREHVPDPSTSRRGRAHSPEKRSAWLGDKFAEVPVFRREALMEGVSGKGPCIVEEYDSTLVVNPDWEWRAEAFYTRLKR